MKLFKKEDNSKKEAQLRLDVDSLVVVDGICWAEKEPKKFRLMPCAKGDRVNGKNVVIKDNRVHYVCPLCLQEHDAFINIGKISCVISFDDAKILYYIIKRTGLL